jgi:hypothetical protein
MKINVIKQHNGSSLIEWLDSDIHRGIVPDTLLNGDQINDEYLSMAIPYGIDWAFALEGVYRTVTINDFVQSLHNHGIWTAEDARRNPNVVQGAILSAYGITFQILMKVAEDFISNGGSVNG